MDELVSTTSPVPVGDRQFALILLRVFLAPLIISLLGASALYWQIHQAVGMVNHIEADDAALARSSTLERLIVDQETGLRGYQNTRETLFLTPYYSADRQLGPAFDQLRDVLGDNSDSLSLEEQLREAHRRWTLSFAAPVLGIVRAGGRTDSVELNLLGKQQMDTMRQMMTRLSGMENAQQLRDVSRWRAQLHRIILVLGIFVMGIGVVVGFYTTTLLRSVLAAFRASNVSLRERAEEARRSEQRLSVTLSTIGEAVITCDPTGRVQSMNVVASDLTAWSEAKAAGQPLGTVLKLLCPQNYREQMDPYTAALAQHGDASLPPVLLPPDRDCILQRPDGTTIYIEQSGAVLNDQTGVCAGYVLVFRDVSLARKARNALLSNERLAVAGRLAASIAHEIHNPLDAVSNLLYLMEDVSSPEEGEQFLQLARSEIARVTQISRAMLSLHREAPTPVGVDLKEMLSSVLLLLTRRFTDQGITVEAHLADHLLIYAFPAELRQVFTNLLINAAEASPRGSIVTLTAEPTTCSLRPGEPWHEEEGACITVEDQGQGVPAETLPHLFEAFVTTKGESGTGLGLWISKGIVTRHGGEIVLESSTDRQHHGTTVTVFLPKRQPLQAASAA